MAEVKNRFRIKSGDIEIEYEGSLAEVNKRFDKAYEWVTTSKPKFKERKEKEQPEKIAVEKEKKKRRGGARKAIYPPEIKKLKEENFFKPKKSLDEVIAKFESMAVPTRGKRNAILNALKADTRKKGSSLKGTKEENVWYFMQD